MPRSTMKEETAYSLPEDVLFFGKLNSVTVRTVEFTRKKDGGGKKAGEMDSFDKWVWEYEVTEGDYTGQRAWGETEDSLNNLEEARGNSKLVRPWAETLLNRTLSIGEDFDTDQVIGLPCKFTVSHDEPRQKKDGGFFHGCPVEDVFPVGPATNRPGEVPF